MPSKAVKAEKAAALHRDSTEGDFLSEFGIVETVVFLADTSDQ